MALWPASRGESGVGGLPAEVGLEAVVGRGGGDELADRRGVVEDVAELGLQGDGVERLGAGAARAPRRW